MNLFTFHEQSEFNLSTALDKFREKEWGVFPSGENKLQEKIKELID